MKNILHLSDFHISDTGSGFSLDAANRVVDALKRDVDSLLHKKGEVIDSLFITGDLSFSGQKSELEEFEKNVLDRIANELSIKKSHVFLVPGNHDCNRNNISRIERAYRGNQEIQELDRLCEDIQKNNEPWERMDGYSEWFEKFVSDNDNLIYKTKLTAIYKITNKLYLVGVNSAWLAQDDDDRERLIVGASQQKLIKDKVPPGARVILLMHHPIDWLRLEENRRFSEFVEKRVDALFFGHMHEFKQSLEANFQYDITLRFQAGTFDTRHKNSGYSVICLDKENDISYGEVFYRRFNQETREFESWIERGNDGAFPFSTIGDFTFDKNKFSEASKQKLSDLNSKLIVNLGVPSGSKKDILDIFVEPNLTIPKSEELVESDSKIKNLEGLIDRNGISFVYAGQNEGKSFLVDYILARGLDLQGRKNFEKVVLKLDALNQDLASESKILKALAGFYFDKDINTSFDGFVRNSLKNGSAMVLVDNFCSSSYQDSLLKFADKYFDCDFVFACSNYYEMEVARKTRYLSRNDIAFVSLGGVKRKSVREMISKWTALSPMGSEKVVYDSLMSVVNKSQLPHNKFTYSMLLAIYENERELSKIFNESDIIENFIEILLNKHKMDRPSHKPQYKDILRYMAFLAKETIVKSKYYFSKNELIDVAKDFNDKTFHKFTYEDYFVPLIDAGILKSDEGCFRFFQSCFLDFGVAYYMSMDSEFKKTIVNELAYLKYNRIVEYYACQNPSNSELLEFMSNMVGQLRAEIRGLIFDKYGVDLEKIDYEHMDELSVLDLAANSEKFEEQLIDLKADRDKRDEMLDRVDPLETDRGHVSEGMHADDLQLNTSIANAEQKFREAISLYGRVNRNMEAVVDAKTVMHHFENLLDGYMFLVKFNIARMDDKILIPLIYPKLEAFFKKQGVNAKEKEEHIATLKGFISLVRSTIPSMVQAQMSEDLSSKKPRISNIIRVCSERTKDELAFALLNYVLIDLDEFDFKKELSLFHDIKSKYVKSTLFFKLMQVVMINHELRDKDRVILDKFAKKLVRENRDLYNGVTSVQALAKHES